MTLQLESVTLKNFGPYRDIPELDLRVTEEAPVVVVHGENTLGKTQLFSALRWCLYGSFTPQQTRGQALVELPARLNRSAARDGARDMSVSVRFAADGSRYHLTRSAQFGGKAPVVSTDLRIGPVVVQQGSIDAEIGRLLHPQISEFFLFDGELMQRFYDRLATDRERALIRESIESVLGIPALQRAERDVATLADDARDRQARAAKNQRESTRIRSLLKDSSNQLAAAQRDKEDLAGVRREAEAELAEVRERVRAVEGLKADVHEQEVLEARLTEAEVQERRLRDEMRSILASGWLAPAAAVLRRRLGQVEADNSVAEGARRLAVEANARVNYLRERVAGGTCPTCQQALPPADANTIQALADAEQAAVGVQTVGVTVDLGLERRIRSLVDTTTVARYSEKQAALDELKTLQYQLGQRLAGIRDRLKGHSAAEIRALGQRQDALEAAIDSAARNLDAISREVAKLTGDIERLSRQLDRLAGASPQVAVESTVFAYIRTLLEKTIDGYRESTRADVEEEATSMFAQLVRDPGAYGGICIAGDYRVDLLDSRGDPMETSEGGKLLVALSLIGALKRAAVRGGPVILDSPLARLDLEHRENVLKAWVPSLGSQAVLLVQSGELTRDGVNRIFGPLVSHEYEITRPNRDPESAVIERVQR